GLDFHVADFFDRFGDAVDGVVARVGPLGLVDILLADDADWGVVIEDGDAAVELAREVVLVDGRVERLEDQRAGVRFHLRRHLAGSDGMGRAWIHGIEVNVLNVYRSLPRYGRCARVFRLNHVQRND